MQESIIDTIKVVLRPILKARTGRKDVVALDTETYIVKQNMFRQCVENSPTTVTS